MSQELRTKEKKLRVARRALKLLAGDGCTNYWGGTTCVTNGRKKNAQYGADRWCDACIARDGLEKSR